MNVYALKKWLEDRQIKLSVVNGKLNYSAPSGVMTPEVLDKIRHQKVALINLLERPNLMPLKEFIEEHHEVAEFYPLSYSQQRVWFLNQFLSEQDPSLCAVFNNPLTLKLEGALNSSALHKALNVVVQQHSVLRASFVDQNGTAQQRTRSDDAAELKFLTVNTTESLEFLIEREIREPIDIKNQLPCRFVLIREAEQQHSLLANFHHIVSDGWSMEVFSDDLQSAYGQIINGESPKLKALPLEFAHYAQWQKLPQNLAASAQDLEYWRDKLQGAPRFLSLFPDYSRPAEQSYITHSVPFSLDADILKPFRTLCTTQGCTLFAGLLAAFNILMSKYNGSSDIVVGTASSGRNDSAIEGLVGYFANTLVLRTLVDLNSDFQHAMVAASETILGAQAHQKVPFEQLVEEFQPTRSFAHSPLFQIFFVLQIAELPPEESGNLMWSSTETINPLGQYDLDIHLRESSSGLVGYFRYSRDLFKCSTIKQLSENFSSLIKQLISAPDAPLNSIALVDATQVKNLENYKPSVPYRLLPEAFASSSSKYPDNIAVACSEKQLSYRNLEERANQLASMLLEKGVVGGDLVAVMMERNSDMMVVLLGILKCGAAYLPLDPNNPDQRINHVIEDSGVRYLVTTAGHSRRYSENLRCYTIEESADYAVENPPKVTIAKDTLAYVIYTSGSTGRPKGVAISHANLASLLADMVLRIPLQSDDVMMAITTISFDIAALEIFAPLLVGARVEIASESTVRDGQLLGQLINDTATIVQATPSSWTLLLDSGWTRPSQLKVLCGGESLPSQLLNRLTENGGTVINVYGPTETTIWSTAVELKHQDPVTIGTPIAGTFCLVLDQFGEIVPDGVPGTLHIGGAGVAVGYWNQKGLTAQKFIETPLSKDGNRIYNTGDIVRRLENGQLQYLGRQDNQVKIFGHRVELGEIESLLDSQSGIAQSAVVFNKSENQKSGQLVAYFTRPENTPRVSSDFGIFFFSGECDESTRSPYDFYLEAAGLADKIGLRAVWTPERHFHSVGGLFPNPAMLGAALAVNTKDISIRAGSVVLPLHDPVRVAEEWAVVDNLSGGRVELAFAAGWNVRDFAIRPEAFESRRQLLEKHTATVRKLWRGESIERCVGGKKMQVKTYPSPIQDELPVWVTASNSIESFQLAGKYGHSLITHLLGQTIDELSVKVKAYREELVNHNWPEERCKIAVMLHTFLLPDHEEAVAVARPPFKEYLAAHVSLDQSRLDEEQLKDQDLLDELLELSVDRYLNTASLIGSPEKCLPIVNKLTSLGIDEIACLLDFGIERDRILNALSNIGELKALSFGKSKLSVEHLSQALEQKLPYYMRPSRYIEVSQFPMTSSGKINRTELASRPLSQVPTTTEKREAQDDVERQVARVWNDVMGSMPESTDDDFFVCGGHSLLASQLVTQLRNDFGRQLPLRVLFEKPSIRGLAEFLRHAPKISSQKSTTDAAEKVPLTHQQRRYWKFQNDCYWLPSKVHNKMRAWRIRGCVGVEKIQAVVNKLVAKHSILRTVIVQEHGKAMQEVLSMDNGLEIQIHDVTDLDTETQSNKFDMVSEQDACCEFDLTKLPSLRVSCLLLKEDEIILILTHHTLILDGISFELLFNELLDGLNGVTREHYSSLEYLEYARQQNSPLSKKQYDEQLSFWKTALQGLPATSSPPLNRARAEKPVYSGDRVDFRISESLMNMIEHTSKTQAATPFMTLATSINLMLAGWSGQSDVAIGTLYANRTDTQLHQSLGFFANTLVLRLRVNKKESFNHYLQTMRKTIMDAFSHHEAPFEDVVSTVDCPPKGADAACQVILVVHGESRATAKGSEIIAQEIELPTRVSRYELCFALTHDSDGMSGRVEFNSEIYDKETVKRFCDEWLDALELWVSDSTRMVFWE